MNDLTNLEIDTKNTVCYTKNTSVARSDMHLENSIQQTNRSMLTTTTSAMSELANVYNNSKQPTMTSQTESVIGGNMNYHVSHEGKFVSVFDDHMPEDKLQEYADKGYKIAYFIRGNIPTVDIMRNIVLSRCKQG